MKFFNKILIAASFLTLGLSSINAMERTPLSHYSPTIHSTPQRGAYSSSLQRGTGRLSRENQSRMNPTRDTNTGKFSPSRTSPHISPL